MPESPHFTMNTVWNTMKEPDKAEEWKNLLSVDNIYPTDKVDIDPVKNITSEKVTALLQAHTNPAVQAVGEYLENIQFYYNACITKPPALLLEQIPTLK